MTNKPTLATVATSGSYTDLTNKPAIANTQWTTTGSNVYYNTGNVGIGKATPTAQLDVLSSNTIGISSTGSTTGSTGLYHIANSNASTSWNLGVEGGAWASGAPLGSLYIDKQDVGPKMTITPDGNVGIGTTTPASKLHIAGADMNNALLFENTSANPGRNYILFKTQGTEQGYIGLGGGATNHMSVAAYGASNNLYLETGSLARMTILPSGNIGIGTTTPGYKLHVAGGTIRCELGSNGVSGAFIGGGSNLQIYHNSGSSVYFLNSASGIYEFYNAGGSTSTGTLVAGGYTTGSDRRLKYNIVNTHFGISDLMKIQVRDYVYKADSSKTLTTGFIAQELYDIFPNAVSKPAKAEDMWSVDYGKVTPLLVKAIQEQQATIEAQQKQIDELKKMVELIMKK